MTSLLFSNPVVKAGLTSATVLSVGDVACQIITLKYVGTEVDSGVQAAAPPTVQEGNISPWRTARFALTGLTLHGPYFYHAFSWLDRKLGTARTLRSAVTKSLVGQVTVFPAYGGLFFAYQTLLEGGTPREAVQRAVDKVPNMLIVGAFFWPPINTANFLFVPPRARVLYVGVAGAVWASYLSWINSGR